MSDDYRDLMMTAAKALGVEPRTFVLPADHDVTLNGVKLHYLDWGNDHLPHIVMVHGGGLTAHTWDMAALLLRDRYHIVALDQRGHGDSDWTPRLDDNKADFMPRDLAAFIDFVGYDRQVLMGMSLGGLVAMRYTVEHPERVSALVAVDISPSMHRVGPYRAGRKGVSFDSFEDMLAHAEDVYTSQPPETVRYDVYHNARSTGDGRWTWKEDRRPRDPEPAELKERYARETPVLEAAMRALPIPTLFMRGQHSRILPLEEAKRVAAMMPNARYVEIADAGHAIQSHNPVVLARELDAFLSDVLPQRASAVEAAERS